LSELIQKYITDDEFRKAIGPYTALHKFYTSNKDKIADDTHFIFCDKSREALIYEYLKQNHICALISSHYDDDKKCFDSGMDSAFFRNTTILYKLCINLSAITVISTKAFLAYLQMIPKDYFDEINRVVRENSKTWNNLGLADYNSDKFLHIEDLFLYKNEEYLRILLDNKVEPFDRQTKSFIKVRTYSVDPYYTKYGVFSQLKSYHKLNLKNINNGLKEIMIFYDFMVKYYTEKSDQEALDILARVVRKPVVEAPVESPVETPVESPVVESPIEVPVVESPIEELVAESSNSNIDKDALIIKLCDELVLKANQFKALLN
jgi:hypothetical protein